MAQKVKVVKVRPYATVYFTDRARERLERWRVETGLSRSGIINRLILDANKEDLVKDGKNGKDKR